MCFTLLHPDRRNWFHYIYVLYSRLFVAKGLQKPCAKPESAANLVRTCVMFIDFLDGCCLRDSNTLSFGKMKKGDVEVDGVYV